MYNKGHDNGDLNRQSTAVTSFPLFVLSFRDDILYAYPAVTSFPLFVLSFRDVILYAYPGSLMNLMKSGSDPFLSRNLMHVRCEMCLKARNTTRRACVPAKKRTLPVWKGHHGAWWIHDMKYSFMYYIV